MPTKTKTISARHTQDSPENEYVITLEKLKKQVREAQLKASLSVNKEMIRLYWDIGKTISEKQKISGWGTRVIEKLAKDLQNE
ncbi:MAG: DUF1016 domain-containing protein, partial [Verrucomicrobia bacterium]|nr:DUF1016 domain-containing protein [Verrucomicrobiota bacterium]